MRKFLKREPIPPRLFVSDGTSRGLVTIADTIGFRNGALVTVRAGSLGVRARVQAVISTTQMILESELQQFLDLSQYTVLASSTVEQMEEQFSPTMEDGELFSSVYESHPVTAIRTTSVDPYGQPYTPDNRLPVDAEVSVVVPPVTVALDALTPPTQADPDNVLVAGSEDGTKGGLKHAVRVDSGLDVRVGISNGSNKAAVSASGELSVRDPMIDVALSSRLNTLGQKTAAQSAPVVLASDQASIPVVLQDEPIKISGTENGQPGGPEFTFVNNVRSQILAAKDRIQLITYADFGTKDERITRIDYTAPSIGTGAGYTARKDLSYSLVGNKYRRDSISWSIV